MAVAIKFCGLTRQPDVAQAEALGADYVGAIFAGGPRNQSADTAQILFSGVRSARRVGVFGDMPVKQIAAMVRHVPLDVVQLHADPTPDLVQSVRHAVGVGIEIWAVVRVAGSDVPPVVRDLFLAADAVVLDTRAVNGLGGTGASFDWPGVAQKIAPWHAPLRGAGRLIVAGGLRPETVAEAIATLQPDVVDVSSGVESAPGIKDWLLMQRFAEAARAVRTDNDG